MPLDFTVVDLKTLPELPPRMVWAGVAQALCIQAINTQWDREREAVYLCGIDGVCKYWTLLKSGDGCWVHGGTVKTVEEAVALLHAWCLVGLSDFTFRED